MSVEIRRPKPRRLVTLKNVVTPGDGSPAEHPQSQATGTNTAALPLNPSTLKGVSLQIDSARVHAVLTDRPSPLLRLIARLTQASSGVVKWHLSLKQRLRSDIMPVAYVPSVRLTPTLTVEEELFLPLAAAGAHVDADFFDSIVDILGLRSVLGQATESLSSAQVVRVGVARSVIVGARLLLLDEPTAGLAEREAQDLLESLLTLRSLGFAVVLQTRSPDVAAVAERVFLLVGGELLGTFDAPESSVLRAEYTTAVRAAAAFESAHALRDLPVSSSASLAAVSEEFGEGDACDSDEHAGFDGDWSEGEGAHLSWQPTRASQRPALTPLPSAYVMPGEGVGGEVEGEASDVAALEELFPSTTTLPLIPRPKQQTFDAASEDVIARAQSILKDLPGSVLPEVPEE